MAPFTSKSQARFMFAVHPAIAKEFAAATPSIKALPERVNARKKVAFKRRSALPRSALPRFQ